MTWTKLLRAKEIVNQRLVMVETKMKCHYRYLIFPDTEQNFSIEKEIIRSGFTYTSWKAAMSAGKKEAKDI